MRVNLQVLDPKINRYISIVKPQIAELLTDRVANILIESLQEYHRLRYSIISC